MRDRSHGRVFDDVAERYDRARPGYPDELFERLRAFAPDAREVLEIGAGTGKATRSLVRFGYDVYCVEPGANLIEVLKRHIPSSTIFHGTFEDWPVAERRFDVAFCASAFQWVDPTVAPGKISKALRPGGVVALAWNSGIESEATEEFFQARQEVFRRTVPEMALVSRSDLKPEEMANEAMAAFDRSGGFTPFEVTRYPFEIEYDAHEYVGLLDSYSPFRVLEKTRREAVYRGIQEIIEQRFGGRVLRPYNALLCLSRAV